MIIIVFGSQHGGDDVNIFAIGPMAHLFSRTHDQTHIANVMAYSAGIGPYKDDSNIRYTSNSGKVAHYYMTAKIIYFENYLIITSISKICRPSKF